MDIVGAYGARYSGKYKNAVAAHHWTSVSSCARLQTSRISYPFARRRATPRWYARLAIRRIWLRLTKQQEYQR